MFNVDYDKARAAWEMEGSADWQRDGIDQISSFVFEARSHIPSNHCHVQGQMLSLSGKPSLGR